MIKNAFKNIFPYFYIMSVFIKRKTKSYEITPVVEEKQEIIEEEQKPVETKKKGRPRLYEPGKNPNSLEAVKKWNKDHKKDVNEISKKYNKRFRESYHMLQELIRLIETKQITISDESIYSKIKIVISPQDEEFSLTPN